MLRDLKLVNFCVCVDRFFLNGKGDMGGQNEGQGRLNRKQ